MLFHNESPTKEITNPIPAFEERINDFVEGFFELLDKFDSFKSLAPVTKPDMLPNKMIVRCVLQMSKIEIAFSKNRKTPMFIGI